jgi:hypothetical protein
MLPSVFSFTRSRLHTQIAVGMGGQQ